MFYKPLPVGNEDFREIIENDYYYVDKTELIAELLDKKGKVNLFTRPRRFGKTLNLNMMRYFFEKPLDEKSSRALFDGLKIMQAGEKYTKEQEQYPVINLTLKSAKQPVWDLSFIMLKRAIAEEYDRHKGILQSEHLEERKKQRFLRILSESGEMGDYLDSLRFLSQCLCEVYQKKVLLFLDEYDVPLENAFYCGFYQEMTAFLRSILESVLKTNPYLDFAVITGCLRISRESIFTGLNNLSVISILDDDYGEYFGFTPDEVGTMMNYYGKEHHLDTVKQWYDGYRFGRAEVYNPWSVMNYVKSLCANDAAFPTASWSNTSSNSIIRDLIYHADSAIRQEVEELVNGKSIEKTIHEDITYEDVHDSEDNLWNFLFFTGYLRQTSQRMDGVNRLITMTIPNLEILYIYENTIINWFRDEVKLQDLSVFYDAMLTGKRELFQEELKQLLWQTISYMDGKEAFYHGFITGLLINLKGYQVKSNREAGNGRYDILVQSLDVSKPPVILEFKLAGKYQQLETACDRALCQIRDRKYAAGLENEGYREVICYGIGFFKKQVKVKMERYRLPR